VEGRSPQTYLTVAEAAWRWVLDQVHDDAGPWIPASVTVPESAGPSWDRDGLHSGIGGLAHVLAEVRLGRPWTAEEQDLAAAIAERVHWIVPLQTDPSYFDGLVSSIGVLTALEAPGADAAVARLGELATPDGWPQTVIGGPRYLPGAPVNDLALGTAGVLLGTIWARRHGVAGAGDVARVAADLLVGEAEHLPTGSNWWMVSRRFQSGTADVPPAQMPNLSHGVAGISAALAVAGSELDRADLTAAGLSGAEHLVSLGDVSAQGFVVPRYLPRDYNDQDEITYSWCHGATGTSLLFLALENAGVSQLAGRSSLSWHRRCLHSVRTSGVPQRLHPGFWDNDGRCCGTAGVGDVFLDSWQRSGEVDDLDFAVLLADTLVERAVREGAHAYWRFLEHHAAEPLLPPGVGWAQGAAGIAAYLFRMGRVLRDGTKAETAPRMDTWWALPATPTPSRSGG